MTTDDDRLLASGEVEPDDDEDDTDEDEDGEEEADDDDDDEKDDEAASSETAPQATPAATPNVTVNLNTGDRPRKKKKGKNGSASEETEDSLGAEFAESAPNRGRHVKVTRVSPESWDFGDGRGMRKCKGYIGRVTNPEDATLEYVQETYGGERFMLQHWGFKPSVPNKLKLLKTWFVDIPGDPKATGISMKPMTGTSTGQAQAAVNPVEASIVNKLIDKQGASGERSHDEAQEERKRADRYARELADEKAKSARLEAENASWGSRFTAMEKTLAAPKDDKSHDNLFAMMLEQSKQSHNMMMALLSKRDKDEERTITMAQTPMQAWMSEQQKAHEREERDSERRFELMLKSQREQAEFAAKAQRDWFELQMKQADKRADRLEAEISTGKKKGSLIEQVKDLAEVQDALDTLRGDGGGEKDMMDKFKEVAQVVGVAAQSIPWLAIGIRGAITGQYPSGMGMPPAPGAGALEEDVPPGAVGGVPGPANEAAAREQQTYVAQLIALLESTLANGTPHDTLASTILSKIPRPLLEQVTTAPPEEIVLELRKVVQAGSPLTTVAGKDHIIATLAAVKKALASG